ncbi:hypothetical protein Poly21_15420 [Allorhodopirellula heiligendammensis]|uniref:Uncharacterized protein n=1 Tax=Allorhodopirellula heiligendammensis TaxID=2714739 RepID=A0A5C6C455_9BACT|nr:hypothetical protein Poly21_15420 [Allorhodopirellula heiligendammensis]
MCEDVAHGECQQRSLTAFVDFCSKQHRCGWHRVGFLVDCHCQFARMFTQPVVNDWVPLGINLNAIEVQRTISGQRRRGNSVRFE